MKKNKGFSIVELIVSFTLTMIIVVILFEIIISLKNIYENSVTKSELISKQNILTNYIYSDINDSELEKVSACGDKCIQFVYKTGDTKNLSWEYEYDSELQKQSFQKIEYGDYAVYLIDNSKFDLSLNSSLGDIGFKGVEICKGDGADLGFLSIKLPVTNSKFENEDFGLNILSVFPAGDVTITGLPTSNNC